MFLLDALFAIIIGLLALPGTFDLLLGGLERFGG